MIPAAELTDEPARVDPHRLRYHLNKIGKCLKGLGATLPDGADPGKLILWIARRLRFPEHR